MGNAMFRLNLLMRSLWRLETGSAWRFFLMELSGNGAFQPTRRRLH
jgi:hypothetical protein